MTRQSNVELVTGIFALIIGNCGAFLVASQVGQSLPVFLVATVLLTGTAAVILNAKFSGLPEESRQRTLSLDELLVLLPAEVRGEIGIDTKELVNGGASANPSGTLPANALIVQLGRHIKNQNDLLLMNFTHLLAAGGGAESTHVFPIQLTKNPVRSSDLVGDLGSDLGGSDLGSEEPRINLDELRSELSALEDQLATDLEYYRHQNKLL